MWAWPWYMSFGKSRVSEHAVSWARLPARLYSSRCPMIGILSTSSTMYQTNCCRWNPGQPFLDTLRCKYTIVTGHFDLHQYHFGRDEHNYSHWLDLQLEGGTFSLPHLMMRYDDAALSQRRDAAPLRLISWLTFGLPYWLQDLVEALMTFYGNRGP